MSDSPKIVIAENVGLEFFKNVMTLHKFPKETALTIGMGHIGGYYMRKAGIPPLVNLWEEIRALLMWGVTRAKATSPTDLPFVIRLHGGGIPTWLVLKIYAAIVYECDAVFFLGDVCIKI